MSMTRVAGLRIDAFRRFRNIDIPFGKSVTLIAGQNATSKSTLLGMLAQPFSFGVIYGRTANKTDSSSYTDNYHGLVLSDYVDLAGRHFMYDCDDIFRLSMAHDTNSSDYRYWTVLENVVESANSPLDGNKLFTRNRPRPSGIGLRFVTGPGPSHKPGEGNFPHPVIYLGLNRLWPLAQAMQCTFTGDALSAEDREWFVQKYNEILCLDEHDNSAQFMDTSEKRKFVTPQASDYDGESCSAGQDNLGQLLTAILSFKHLKQALGSTYRGGMLLIDELDAALHAYAQNKLLELLCEVCTELGLQVVATTHSLFLLERALESPVRRHAKVIYLANSDGRITLDSPTRFADISDRLKVTATLLPARAKKKVSVVFEDEEGQHLFQQICGTKLRKYISVGNTDAFGAGDLKNLAVLSTKLPALQDVILVPDGDMARTWTVHPRNLVTLPGGARPETLAYRHLFALADSDAFWGKPIAGYTRQFAVVSKGGTSLEKGDDKQWVKRWFKGQSEYWERGDARVFKSWVAAHKQECYEFCKAFVGLLNKKSDGRIPRDAIDATLAQFR